MTAGLVEIVLLGISLPITLRKIWDNNHPGEKRRFAGLPDL